MFFQYTNDIISLVQHYLWYLFIILVTDAPRFGCTVDGRAIRDSDILCFGIKAIVILKLKLSFIDLVKS